VSLWFVNAVGEYLRYTDDRATTAKQLLEPVLAIVAAYEGPTVLGTSLDADGLLQTRCAGLAATWMDAQLGVHPITPRTGKAVELNALWHNALHIAADLCAANDRVGFMVRDCRVVGPGEGPVCRMCLWDNAKGLPRRRGPPHRCNLLRDNVEGLHVGAGGDGPRGRLRPPRGTGAVPRRRGRPHPPSALRGASSALWSTRGMERSPARPKCTS